MPDYPISQAIAEWQNQLITSAALMRRLVSYDSWMLPVSEAAAAEMASTGDPLDTIETDPATSWQISYRREQFPPAFAKEFLTVVLEAKPGDEVIG